MGALHAEIIKLNRSLGWGVVLLLPLAMVGSGIVNTAVSGQGLADGWHTLWLRSMVFYGLFPAALGVAVLGSLVWRPEHRGSNRNALMSTGTPTWQVASAKSAAVTLLAVAMQVVMLVGITVAGKVVFALPGLLPGRYLLIGSLVIAATIPLACLQSALSMVFRSFAGPIAFGFVGAGISVAGLMAAGDRAIVSPYALLARATQLGTGTFADDGTLTGPTITLVLLMAVLLAVVIQWCSSAWLDRSEIH